MNHALTHETTDIVIPRALPVILFLHECMYLEELDYI